MLKSVFIKNVKGLRGEHSLDFEAKELKQSQIEKENSIGLVNGTKIMKAPILIAKNASGKSTVLEAINMGMKFKDLDEYLKTLAEEILYEEARSLINFAEVLRNDLSSLFMDRSGSLIKFRKDKEAKELALGFMNGILKEIKSTSRRLDSTFDFDDFDELSEESLTSFGDKVNKELSEIIGGLVLFNPKAYEFFDFTENFEIKLVDTDDNVRSINNNGISTEKITEMLLSDIMKELHECVLLPIWDCIHVVSEVIEDSTEVYSAVGSIDASKGFNSFKQVRAVAMRYESLVKTDNHLFDSVSMFGRTGKSSLRTAMKYLDKEMGQEFLERVLKMVDKNISHIEESGKNILIINNEGRKISPDSLSFGTKKVLELIYFAFINKSEGFIMIDEIENGLNISLINLLYKLLDELDLQVISTTHNPSIIYQGIVSPVNAFINNGSAFVSARDTLETKRPANLISLFRPENYKNDFHIANSTGLGFSTNSISPADLDRLLDIVEERMV